MDVRTCRKCKKLFNYITGPTICPACRDSIEEDFKVVKAYIQEHPHVDMRTVSEECDVDVAQIRQWVREERLEFSSDSIVGLNCDRCGKVIKSGKFCPECKADMQKSFSNAIGLGHGTVSNSKPEKQEKSGPKMRFLE